MPLLDLSLVTLSLTELLDQAINASDAWSAANTLDVLPYPPDKLTGDNAVGFYLYHVMEETGGGNTYIPGVSDTPVRYIPLGLHLYYLLTAHSDLDGETASLREQLMMGLAMKALHDFPFITDETRVNGVQVMQGALRGRNNRLRVNLLPVKYDHAVNYWTAGQSPLRLSAYYQVSIVELEPEEPQTTAGRVLAYGVYVFPTDSPRIVTTENALTFTIPGESDPRSVVATPAQVTYDQPFTVRGSAFTRGDDLLIRRMDANEPLVADAAWNVRIRADRIEATVRATASGVTLVPGIYAASVRSQKERPSPIGTKVLDQTSNESPFAIAPRITAVGAPDAQNVIEVTGDIFQGAGIVAEDVVVWLGAQRLALGTPGALNPGEFAIDDADTLHLRLPAGLAPGSYGFRLIINGAENAPVWITV